MPRSAGVVHGPIDNEQFHERGGPGTVEDHQQAIAAAGIDGRQQPIEHQVGRFVGGHQPRGAGARLAVLAHADFHLVVGQLEDRLAGGGVRGGLQATASVAICELKRSAMVHTCSSVLPSSAAAPAIL